MFLAARRLNLDASNKTLPVWGDLLWKVSPLAGSEGAPCPRAGCWRIDEPNLSPHSGYVWGVWGQVYQAHRAVQVWDNWFVAKGSRESFPNHFGRPERRRVVSEDGKISVAGGYDPDTGKYASSVGIRFKTPRADIVAGERRSGIPPETLVEGTKNRISADSHAIAAAADAIVSTEERGGEAVPPIAAAVATIPTAITPTSAPVEMIPPADNTSSALAEPRTLSDFEKIPVGQRARVMADMQAEIVRLNADTERMRRARTEAPPAAPPDPRPADAHTEPVPGHEPRPAADPSHRTTPDAHHGATHAAGGHAHGEHHGHAHHDHGEPWHLPRNLNEWGWLGAATIIGAWNVTKWLWNYIVHPTVHAAGYIASGDAKHPWATFWSNIKKEFGKPFSKKGGGGGHGGGSHGGGSHGGGGHH